MGTYNGTLKKWNATGEVWDELLPKTTADNIISGTLHLDRIPTMDEDHIPSLPASKITSGTIDAARLPAIALTNVVSYTTMAAFSTAYSAAHNLVQAGDVVVLTTDKKTYIHNGGSTWTSADLTLLQTPTDVVTSVAGKVGVVTLVKGDVGLGNVDNTSDANKPVSTAQQTALNLKANLASPTFTGTVGGITKAMVGLGNVDNTSDANKPVSTAQQTALDLKLNTSGGALSGSLVLNQTPNGTIGDSFGITFKNGISAGYEPYLLAEYNDAKLYRGQYTDRYAIFDEGHLPDWTEVTNKPTFATVATSGSYNDLSNKPTIPTIPSIMTTTEGKDGISTSQRTINAISLKSIILYHSPQMLLVDTLPTADLVDGQMVFEY